MLGSLVKTFFTTKLGKLIDNYQDNENPSGKNENNTNSSMNLTTSVDNIYLRSPDMQMLLNLLAEKEGMWSAILILSIFDSNFKNHFRTKQLFVGVVTCQKEAWSRKRPGQELELTRIASW